MKKIKIILKLQAPGGQATPAPPIGPALGQYGVNIGQFVTEFNQATSDQQGVVLPIELTIYEDRSFGIRIKTPASSYLLKKAAGLEKGSAAPVRQKAGQVTQAQIQEIARQKMPDLNTQNLAQAVKIIEGSAKSIGLEVVK